VTRSYITNEEGSFLPTPPSINVILVLPDKLVTSTAGKKVGAAEVDLAT